MDVKDIAKVNALSGEKRAIQVALETFDAGGRIVAISVGHAPVEGELPRPTALIMGGAVPTMYIDYPPQMVDSIKMSFRTRLSAITDELEELGVTGV